MKYYLAFALLSVTLSAEAAWEETYNDPKKGFSFFVDPTTIQFRGASRRVWQLQNWKTPQANGARSRVQLMDFDCTEMSTHEIQSTDYSEEMGRGEMIKFNPENPANVVYPQPNSIAGIDLKAYCSLSAPMPN